MRTIATLVNQAEVETYVKWEIKETPMGDGSHVYDVIGTSQAGQIEIACADSIDAITLLDRLTGKDSFLRKF